MSADTGGGRGLTGRPPGGRAEGGDEAVLAHLLIDAMSVVGGTLATLRASRAKLDDAVIDELLEVAERKSQLVIEVLRGSITAGSTGALILLSGNATEVPEPPAGA